jgi:hypothetical protein
MVSEANPMRIGKAREPLAMLTAEIAKQLEKKLVSEKTVLRDFDHWKKARRETGRPRPFIGSDRRSR